MSKPIRVRFRTGRGRSARSAVLSLPLTLREQGALAQGARFNWSTLSHALGHDDPTRVYRVTALGTEGNPFGEGELVVHVS